MFLSFTQLGVYVRVLFVRELNLSLDVGVLAITSITKSGSPLYGLIAGVFNVIFCTCSCFDLDNLLHFDDKEMDIKLHLIKEKSSFKEKRAGST